MWSNETTDLTKEACYTLRSIDPMVKAPMAVRAERHRVLNGVRPEVGQSYNMVDFKVGLAGVCIERRLLLA